MANWMALGCGLGLGIMGATSSLPAAQATTPADDDGPFIVSSLGLEGGGMPFLEDKARPDQEKAGPGLEPEVLEQLPGGLESSALDSSALESSSPDAAAALESLPPNAEAVPVMSPRVNAEAIAAVDEVSVGVADGALSFSATSLSAMPTPEFEPGLPPESQSVISGPAQRSQAFGQAAYLQQGDEGSARLRGGVIYGLSPSVLAGVTVDLSTGQAFSDNDQTGFSLNELYLTASPARLPELRLTAGLMDLTSYLDRNSFAKDSLTHFFNPVFQTNPALSASNLSSRPGALVNWTPVDELSLTATTFSSRRSLGDFSLDSFAGEVGVRWGNAIVRGTYVTSRDSGRGDGFQEIFAVDRGGGEFGPRLGDRETGFGLNAEVFIPGLELGVFGRYGWYTNQALGASGQTYSVGVNRLDVLMAGDRLGLGYGRQLSNSGLRQASGNPVPDVWELFYDTKIIDNLRAGVSLQQRNAWTETYLGFRLRYDLVWNPPGRATE